VLIPLIVITITLALISLAATLYLAKQQTLLKQRVTASLGHPIPGSDPQESQETLETTLARHLARVREVDHRLAELEKEHHRHTITNSVSSQKISIIRYNPFPDTGGDQSFCLAVLDAHDSGYVLSSIHARQGTRVYIKPIDLGQSKYPLSDEEQQALTRAKTRVPHFDTPERHPT